VNSYYFIFAVGKNRHGFLIPNFRYQLSVIRYQLSVIRYQLEKLLNILNSSTFSLKLHRAAERARQRVATGCVCGLLGSFRPVYGVDAAFLLRKQCGFGKARGFDFFKK